MDRGCEYMPVAGVVGHRRNQIFMAFDPGTREVPLQRSLAAFHLAWGQAELVRQSSVRQSSVDFIDDAPGPFWLKHSDSGQSQQSIGERHRHEYASVKKHRTRRGHSPRLASGGTLRS